MTVPQHPFERPRPPAGASTPGSLSDQSDFKGRGAEAVEALAEWLAASEALRDVNTGDPEAIRAALDRVDAAKATARALIVGQRPQAAFDEGER